MLLNTEKYKKKKKKNYFYTMFFIETNEAQAKTQV